MVEPGIHPRSAGCKAFDPGLSCFVWQQRSQCQRSLDYHSLLLQEKGGLQKWTDPCLAVGVGGEYQDSGPTWLTGLEGSVMSSQMVSSSSSWGSRSLALCGTNGYSPSRGSSSSQSLVNLGCELSGRKAYEALEKGSHYMSDPSSDPLRNAGDR